MRAGGVMRVRSIVAIVTLFMGIIGGATRAHAAEPALRGTAVDSSGGVLPGVTVTATPAAAPQADPQLQVTDGDGKFAFDDLPAGTYVVVLSLPGFEDKKYD